MGGVLWIVDAELAARDAVRWALRDRFSVVVELDGFDALMAEVARVGPVERVVDEPAVADGQWRLALLIVGERRTVTLAFRDGGLLERLRIT